MRLYGTRYKSRNSFVSEDSRVACDSSYDFRTGEVRQARNPFVPCVMRVDEKGLKAWFQFPEHATPMMHEVASLVDDTIGEIVTACQ